MCTNFLLHVILISCLLAGCCAVCAPAQYLDPRTAGQPTPNPYELTPTPDMPIPVGGGGYAIAWSSDGKWMIIPTGHGVSIYNADTLLQDKHLNPDESYQNAAFGLNAKLVVMVDRNYTASTWDLNTHDMLERRDIVEIKQISGLCPAEKYETYPDNLWLVCLDRNSETGLYNVRHIFYMNKSLINPPESVSSDGSVWAIAYNNYGHVVAEVYNIAKGTKIGLFRTPRGVKMVWLPDFSIALSSNGALVAIGDYADHVTVWRTNSQEMLYDCKANFPIQHMSFSPNNQRLALIDDKNHAVLELTGQGCQITNPTQPS